MLSFPNSKNSGEIVICMQVARSEAKNFDMSVKSFVAFLVIHGILHLKGHAHGSTMEKAEKKFLRKFGF